MLLKQKFNIDNFYDEQWQCVESLLNNEKVLLIQKTGFGKSLCFQFPAIMLSGTTIVFSPLIALMRDQIKGLRLKGISAECINSEQTKEENDSIIQNAIAGKIKILYIAPERQENSEWINAVKNIRISLVVIDEAHCISQWGHDFRPSFRRIINLVKLLPDNIPILAATATATPRVQKDIEQQIGSNIKTIRGDLYRSNFVLETICLNSEDEKLLWIAQNLSLLNGTGLIYTGTRVSTELYSRWLEFLGENSISYNAGLDSDNRKIIEDGLMNNKYKCVISTNALGMGLDKPDIRFIIHTQMPASVIHYYQEIGRAGRDGLNTNIVLLFNASKDKDGCYEDKKLPLSFINSAKPSTTKYQKVIEILKQNLLRQTDIQKQVNLKQTQARVIINDLIDQGIIRLVMNGRSKYYEYVYNSSELNTDKFEVLRNDKLSELDKMLNYITTNTDKMQFLCEYLGDNTLNYKHYKVQSQFSNIFSPYLIDKLQEFHENFFPILNIENNSIHLINGVAASYYGVSNVGLCIHKCKYENGGMFPDYLLKQTLRAFYKRLNNYKFDLILFVPPSISGNLVQDFAKRLSISLKIPFSTNLIKTREIEKQKILNNAYSKKDNVKDAFDYLNPQELIGKKILLFDDIFDSGITLKEIARVLRKYGAELIAPLTIARTIGSDSSD